MAATQGPLCRCRAPARKARVTELRDDLLALDPDHHPLRAVLLIIMVTLFDIIFRWLPYFIICFPIPGLKAKE